MSNAGRKKKGARRFVHARLYVAQKGRCFHCAAMMEPYPSRTPGTGALAANGWTREHVIPLSAGGINVGNVVLAHRPCNTARGNSEPTPEMIAKAIAIQVEARTLTYKHLRQVVPEFFL